MKKINYLISVVLIGLMGCKQPYTPTATAANANAIVIEGVINTGLDSTIIKLSRTVSLGSKSSLNPELGAVVTIESDHGGNIGLNDQGNGTYSSGILYMDSTGVVKYRLRVQTRDGSEYLTDFAASKYTPPIDSVGFTVQSGGIQLYANTHDATNNTRYYRWDYAETWQFHAKYEAAYMTDGAEIINRPIAQQNYICYGNTKSSSIVLGSSAKLQQDVIYQQPLTQVVSTSEKLETEYSLLVKQYALTKEEFSFWENLKKNTEQLGSIFDAQPSNVSGNIHSNSFKSTPAIGWISVTNVREKRVFIPNSAFPQTFFPAYPYECTLDSNLFCRLQGTQCFNEVQAYLIPLNAATLPIAPITTRGSPAIIGYLGTSIECADCTIRGSSVKPSFWR